MSVYIKMLKVFRLGNTVEQIRPIPLYEWSGQYARDGTTGCWRGEHPAERRTKRAVGTGGVVELWVGM